MKRILAALCVVFCVCLSLAACSEKDDSSSKKTDSFLAGGIWEAVIKTADNDGYVIAYQFKDDGSYLLYRNLVVISEGEYKNDDSTITLINPQDNSKSWVATYTYDKESGVLVMEGKSGSTATDNKSDDSDTTEAVPTMKLSFTRITKEEETYYDESKRLSWKWEKQTEAE